MQSNEGYSRAFRAPWRSGTGIAEIGLCVIAVSCLLIAARGPQTVTSWTLVVGGLLQLWLAWFVGRPLLGSGPVFSVDADGIAVSGVKSGTLRWRDVMDTFSAIRTLRAACCRHLAQPPAIRGR